MPDAAAASSGPASTVASASAAAVYADRLVAALVAAGVRDIVVCPGSRSQAIALAAARLARAGEVDVHVRIDERSAGFFAVGLVRESGSPAAIVVTSGTAVANLHPAMLEAHHSDLPLIAVTADRPAELQAMRANQTTRQPGIFGEAARAVIEVSADALDSPEADAVAAVRAALGWRGQGPHTERGPVQVNVQLRDPLSGGEPARATRVEAVEDPERGRGELRAAPRTIVIAGADAGRDAAAVAAAIGAPLIAEPSSGARFGPQLVLAPRSVLAGPLADEVRRVVVLGHPTLSRGVSRLLGRADVEVVTVGRAGLDNVRGTGEGTVLTGAVSVEPIAEADEAEARAWVQRWVAAGRAAADADDDEAPDPALSRSAYARAELAASRRAVSRRDLVTMVWDRTWPHDRLVVAASRLIRELDEHAGPKPLVVHANRGLAGIDGTISTAVGVATALARERTGGITRLLIGDLAFLHDVGGLLLEPGEEPALQIVVGNDRGGSLFELLEVRGTAPAADFDRVLRTPHDVTLGALAAAYGWPHERVVDRGGLAAALSGGARGIVEVMLDGTDG